MGAMSRRKGGRVEREIVKALKDAGIPAERVPLSGAHGGSFAGDVVVAKRWRVEVKARKHGSGFTQLERWLGSNDMLILKRNGQDPMVLLPWDLAKALLLAAHCGQAGDESRLTCGAATSCPASRPWR